MASIRLEPRRVAEQSNITGKIVHLAGLKLRLISRYYLTAYLDHISRYAHTRVASVKSPWLARMDVGQVHTIPLSHGEGRFTAPAAVIADLVKHGQVALGYAPREVRRLRTRVADTGLTAMLEARRQAAGLTQAEVARRMGVTQSTVS